MRAEIFWIEGPWPGRLAILPRPRGGDWLEDEVASWHRAGIGVVVSALTREEENELDLVCEAETCEAEGVAFVALPIPDRGVPASARLTTELARRLEARLAGGENIAVHCRQGVGRSALVAACLFVASGVDPTAAFERIQVARGCGVPDTAEQREWVGRFAAGLQAAALKKE